MDIHTADTKKAVTAEKSARPAADPVLMDHQEILLAFHRTEEQTETAVLHFIETEDDLLGLLEILRTERDWRHIRAYLSAIETFSDRIEPWKKEILLRCLHGMLAHESGTVRRMTGRAAGRLLATCGSDVQGRAAWKNFLHSVLFPGKEYSERQRRWMGFSIRFILRALLEDASEEKRRGILHTYAEYFKSTRWDTLTCLFLIDGIADLPYSLWSTLQQNMITGFARHFFSGDNTEIHLASLRLFRNWLADGWRPPEQILLYLAKLETAADAPDAEKYLAARIRGITGKQIAANPSLAPLMADASAGGQTFSPDPARLMLEDERSETPWLIKLVNLRILQTLAAEEKDPAAVSSYAFHLLHMVRFSDTVVIRRTAASMLEAAAPRLPEEDRLVLAGELCKAVESGEEASADSVPACLGGIFYTLEETDRQEIFERLHTDAMSERPATVLAVLEAVGFILRHMPDENDPADLLGILCRGLASSRHATGEEACFLIGHMLFGSEQLSALQKSRCYSILGRRLLAYLTPLPLDDSILYTASSIRIIDAFLQSGYAPTSLDETDSTRPVAFFPGTFDPFTAGHLAVVQEALSLGYRVFIVLDESFWQKRPQPYAVRRRMIEMSIAELSNCYLYPHPVSFRLRNLEDMEALAAHFPGHRLCLISGDKKSGHISLAPLTGDSKDVRVLRLPAAYARMSSSFIRNAIACGQDITGMLDEQVRRFILENHFYTGDPLYRRTAPIREMEETLDTAGTTDGLAQTEAGTADGLVQTAAGTAEGCAQNEAGADVEIDIPEQTHLLRIFFPGEEKTEAGCAVFHVEPSENEQWDSILPPDVSGDLCIIHGISGSADSLHDNALTVLDELLAYAAECGCSCAFIKNPDAKTQKRISLAGFVPLRLSSAYAAQENSGTGSAAATGGTNGTKAPDSASGWWYVRMEKTIVLFSDAISFVREPWNSDPDVQKAVSKAHIRLRKAAARLYPGCLLLNFESDILNGEISRIVSEIGSDASVEDGTASEAADQDGRILCVPFGKILKGVRIPSISTRELNTEKVYTEDLSHFRIGEFPGYASLPSQIRTLRSFRKPVVLVDDLYHKGYRMDKIRELFREEGISSEILVTGVLSGRGAALAAEKGIDVCCGHYVPHMTAWLLESDLYPFIGGDGIEQAGTLRQRPGSPLPSINPILPYAIPHFLEDADRKAFFRLSETALQNAREILLVLEKKFQKDRHRRLTPDRLVEVMTEPRYPVDTLADRQLPDVPVSDILTGELARLQRFRNL